MNDNAKTHLANFRDRMEAVRYALIQNSVPALDKQAAAMGHFNLLMSEMEKPQANEHAPLYADLYTKVQAYLMARALSAFTTGESAEMDRLRNALRELTEAVGFNPKAPYGTPHPGTVWGVRNATASVTVIDIYMFEGNEHVAYREGVEKRASLVLLSEWHHKFEPLKIHEILDHNGISPCTVSA